MIIRKCKKVIEKIALGLCAVLPFKLLRWWARKSLIILNYHSIYQWDKDEKIKRKVYRTEDQLQEDLKFLKNNFEVIEIDRLINSKQSKTPLPSHSLLITFDDGLKVVYDKIYPLLRKEELPAVVFVNPSFVDNRDMHYLRKKTILLGHIEQMNGEFEELSKTEQGIKLKEKINQLHGITYAQKLVLYEVASLLGIDFVKILKDNPLYLSVGEIHEMIDGGVAIGAHSMDHPPFEELTVQEQYDQIKESVDWVVDKFNLDYKVFAFPSNDRHVKKTLFEMVKPHVDLTFGVQGLMKDEYEFHYHRIEIEATGKKAITAFKYEYLKLIILCLLGKSKVKRY